MSVGAGVSVVSFSMIGDRFMQKHVEELYDHVYTNTSPAAQKRLEWQTIVDRVQNQLYLRVVSCCQIASKLNSHYKVCV